MERYFVLYDQDRPASVSIADETTSAAAIEQLLSRGWVEVNKEEYDRCVSILFPPVEPPEPPTLEEVVDRVAIVEQDVDEVKRGLMDVSMRIPE